jgi:hypothetical protein
MRMTNSRVTQTPEGATGSQKLATELIDTVELCRRLNCPRRTSTNLRDRRKLPAIILGRLVRYLWPTVEAALLRRFVAAIIRHPARDLKAASRANRRYRLAGARRRSPPKKRA